MFDCGCGLACELHVNIIAMGPIVRFLSILSLLGSSVPLALCQDSNYYRLKYNITEEQEPGIFVGNTAVDTGLFSSSSSEDFQLLKFEMFTQGNPYAQYFVVDEQDGVVRTKSKIDREVVCESNPECTMLLDMAVYRKTSASGSFDFFKSIQVAVRVEDVNDNPPKFPQKVVTLSMPENWPAPYRLYTSVATDLDKRGINSDITYRLESNSIIFNLEIERNAATGLSDLAIVVNQMLDREAMDRYLLTIVASDSGVPKLSGSVFIGINVTDVNDNRPVFLQNNYSTSVFENASLVEPVLVVSAEDLDINDNGRVVYQLGTRVDQEVRDTFRVGESDGKIYLKKPIDYEQRNVFKFLLEAWDRGSPPQSSTTFVAINVIDVNDNAPQIILNLSPDGTDIVEHEPPGKFLGHISVSDSDSGVNGNVVCEIDDQNFRLEAFDGQRDIYKIILAQSLDREQSAIRRVTIRCRDGDRTPRLATKSFEVRVIDINDNAPIFFQSPLTGVISENQPVGSNVVEVSAEDPDEGDNGRVVYSLTGNRNFSIDPLTGMIKSLVSFDREQQAVYQFYVYAQDYGNPPRTSSSLTVINIMDQNDHPPHFLEPVFQAEVKENLPPGSPVGKITAFDQDASPENSRKIFTIVRDEENSRYFSINKDTGLITSNVMFDRETRQSYSIFVDVQDPNVSYYKDSAQVVITILDDNDHYPEIYQPSPGNNSVTLQHNTTVGSLVSVVRVRDLDDPSLTSFHFSIEGGDDRYLFEINPSLGELRLAREVQPGDANTHVLLIVVTDGGSNPKSASITLIINIPADGWAAGASANVFQEQNFVIIIIIVSVTVIAALLIIITICIIIHRDRRRTATRAQQKQVKDKIYQAAHWVSTHSLPHGDNLGSREIFRRSETCGEKKSKKEKPPMEGRHFVFVSGKSSPGSNSTSCYESTDSHTYQNTGIAETDDRLNMQLDRGGEDALSATSGESGTSDSGRGGSEDEAHSHRGSSLESESRHYNPAGSVSSSGISSSSSGVDHPRRVQPSLSSLPEERPPRCSPLRPKTSLELPSGQSHPPRDPVDKAERPVKKRLTELEPRSANKRHDYFRSSAEQLPTHGLGYPAGCSQNSSAADAAVAREGYMSLDRTSMDGPFRIRDAQQGRKTFHTFGPQYQHSHPVWRRAKGLDEGWRSVTPTTSSYANTDDDDVTTTSGSYTLSPDDRQNDVMDDLPFQELRDVMV